MADLTPELFEGPLGQEDRWNVGYTFLFCMVSCGLFWAGLYAFVKFIFA